jgi:hypothetical protein
VAGIEQLIALRSGSALLDFCASLAAMLGQPSFWLVKQGNGVPNELVHALLGSAVNVLLYDCESFGDEAAAMFVHSFEQGKAPGCLPGA